MKSYLVGGAVRDRLLNLPIKDRDWVVVGSNPEALRAKGYKPIGKDFPVFLHPDSAEEYALARTERKTAKGYQGFVFHTDESVTLKADLQRRDLTINALALDDQEQIIDYYNGQKDLDARLLRHVSPAFREDPVRILRTARFLARFQHLGFRIADETLILMQEMVKEGEVDALVAERVWQETERALSEPNPEAFFETLRACGALAILFPELDALFGVPQVKQHHPEIDTGVHTLMVLQQAVKLSPLTEVRFAALVHDLGKGTTQADMLPHHYGHEQRGKCLVTQLCQRYRIPKRFRILAEQVAYYHTHVHKAFDIKNKTLLKVLENIGAFRQESKLEQFLLACKADSLGRLGHEQNDYPQLKYYLDMFAACQKIDIQTIIAEGHKGAMIAEQLRRQRLCNMRLYQKQE